MVTTKTKSLPDSFLYKKANLDRIIYSFIMTSDPIDKHSEAFSDIVYQVKSRQVNSVLYSVMMSDKIKLCLGSSVLSGAFKVIRAKDIKGNKENYVVYIDCNGIIEIRDGVYRCRNISVFISYLIQAMTQVIYYDLPDAIIRNQELTELGCKAFSDLMLYILGYLKVPVTYADNKEKIIYLCSLYYQRSILWKDDSNMIGVLAKKVSKLDAHKCEYYDIIINNFYEDHNNIITIEDFLLKFNEIFSDNISERNKVTIDAFVDRWMYIIGKNTFLGLELFPYFANIMTDCYIGAYLNSQNTIEKIVGRTMALFTTELLNIGSKNA